MATSLAATAAFVLFPGTAYTAETLGASAAESGRYFGAAVVPSLLGDSTYSSTLDQDFNSVVARRAEQRQHRRWGQR